MMRDEPVPRVLKILLVEDNPGDVRLTMEALKEAKLLNEVHAVDDGEKALAFLRRETPYENACTPDLVLLDLNLPRMDGKQVLAEMKSDPSLRSIPVVVLTTSQDARDVLATYNLFANCYIAKPVDLDQFLTVVRSIEQFWLALVTLPSQRECG